MAIIHGRTIKIYRDGVYTLIAGAKSCTIHKQSEVIETSDSTNQTEKTYIPGRSGWSIDISHLVTTSTGGIPLVGSTYNISVKINNNRILSGTAICTSADIVATVGNLAQGSIKLQGTGALT